MKTPELIQAENIRKQRLAGLLPRYMNNSDILYITAEQEKNVPFSKHYNTYREYLADTKLVQQMTIEYKEIPDSLFEKLRETGIELGIIKE